MEDGKEKIKKIQAAKAALGADHLAKDKNIKRPNQEKWKPLAMKYLTSCMKIFMKFIIYIRIQGINNNYTHPPFHQLYMKFHIYLIKICITDDHVTETCDSDLVCSCVFDFPWSLATSGSFD